MEAPLYRMRIRAMRQIQPRIPLFKQREAWLQFAKQAAEPQTFQLAISSPLKEQSLCLPLSFCLPLFLAAPEMRDDPPLRRWQAWVGDGIARARNIDRKTKSVQSRAKERDRKWGKKLKLKESMRHHFFIAWRSWWMWVYRCPAAYPEQWHVYPIGWGIRLHRQKKEKTYEKEG